MNLKYALLVLLVLIVGGYFVFRNSDNETTTDMSNETTSEQTKELSTIANLLQRGEDIRCVYDNTDDQGNKNTGTAYFSNMRMSGNFMVIQSDGQELQSNVLNLGDTQYVWDANTKQGYKINTENIDVKDDGDTSVAVDEDEEYDFSCEKWNVDNSMFEVPSDVNFVDNSEILNNIESQLENIGNVCEQLTDPAQRQACEQSVN